MRRILDLPRYDAMRGGQTLWDRLLSWIVQGLAAIVLYLFAHADLSPPYLLGLASLLLLIIAAAVLVVVRSTWTRGRMSVAAQAKTLRVANRNRFAAAEELAAGGEFRGALRELVAGVAGEVGNRPFWDASPLTVRELFAREGLLEELADLLGPFEASVYGRRPVTAAEYQGALRAASRFRSSEAA